MRDDFDSLSQDADTMSDGRLSESRRALLREVEVKVIAYQDEIESGARKLKPGVTLAQQVEHLRKKLMRKIEREDESPDRKRKISPPRYGRISRIPPKKKTNKLTLVRGSPKGVEKVTATVRRRRAAVVPGMNQKQLQGVSSLSHLQLVLQTIDATSRIFFFLKEKKRLVLVCCLVFDCSNNFFHFLFLFWFPKM